MFKQNNQPSLFSFESELSQKQQKILKNSKEKHFYELIYCNIKETDFKVLYSNTSSRPNTPVNILVSALILKELKNISYDELMGSIMFDLRIKTALGLEAIEDSPFARATLFNFQIKISDYEKTTGINLIESVFDNLSEKQIKKLSLKADIQRADSTLIGSNIKKYSRVQLLIEVLLRLERIFNDTDKKYFSENLKSYMKGGSQKYVYKLKPSEFPHELNNLGELYYSISTYLGDENEYSDTKEFENFTRIFQDHFKVEDDKTIVKENNELNSGMLQSPDDQEATYRKKRDIESKGFTINATETANPENPIQLINDVVVNPNNIDDTKILNERLDKMKEKSPTLNELHTDGGYGSEDNDEKLEKLEITQITTAVRGRERNVEIKISQKPESENYTVECPLQKIESTPTIKRNKAIFDIQKCEKCPLKDKCQIYKHNSKIYFTHQDFLQNKRNNNIHNIPAEHQKIRPNVEATMNEFKCRTNGGKLKVRGLFKTSVFAYSVAIAINFGRIFRYITSGNCGNFILNYFLSIFSLLILKYHQISTSLRNVFSNYHVLLKNLFFSIKILKY